MEHKIRNIKDLTYKEDKKYKDIIRPTTHTESSVYSRETRALSAVC